MNALAENSNGADATAARIDSTSSSTSNVTIYFIELGVNEEDNERLFRRSYAISQQLKDIHKKAFQLCDENSYSPVWAGQELLDVNCANGKIRDVFVLPIFQGPLFDHLVKNKCRIYGSPYVMHAIQNEKPLVRIDHPIYSVCMQDVIATVSGLQEQKEKISQHIHYMGGLCKGSLIQSTTHVITDKRNAMSKKCQICVKHSPRRALLSSDWIWTSWNDTNLHLGQPNAACANDRMKSYVLPFAGLTIVCSGYLSPERKELQNLVERGGGTFTPQLKRHQNTHLVVEKDSGEKYLKAMEWGDIKCVKRQWLIDCMDNCITLEETPYFTSGQGSLLGDPRSTHSRTVSTPVSSQAPLLNDPEVSQIPGMPNMTVNSNMSMESRAPSQMSGRQLYRSQKMKNGRGKLLTPVQDKSVQRTSGSVARMLDAGETPRPLNSPLKEPNRTGDPPVIDLDLDVFYPVNANQSLPPTIEAAPVEQANAMGEAEEEASSYAPIFHQMDLGLLGFDENDYQSLKEEVEACQGTVVDSGVVEYLIVPICVNNINRQDAAKFQAKQIVTNTWMQMSCDLEQLLDLDEEAVYRPLLAPDSLDNPLANCVICISGLGGALRDTFAHLATMLGAVFQESMVKKPRELDGQMYHKTTHLLLDKPEGSKYEAALKWGELHAMSTKWIVDCFQNGMKLDENEYLIEKNPQLKLNPLGIDWLNKTAPSNPRLKALRLSSRPSVSSFSPARGEVGSPMARSTPNHPSGRDQANFSSTSMVDSPGKFLNSGFQPRFDVRDADLLIGNGGKERELWQEQANTDDSLMTFVGRQLAGGAEKILNTDPESMNDKSFTDKRSEVQRRTDSEGFGQMKRNLRSVSTSDRPAPAPVVQRPVASQICDNFPSPASKNGPLKNVTITVSKKLIGMQESLFKQVKKLGGDYKYMIEPETTHFVYKGKMSEDSGEYFKAKTMKALIVSPDWINECAKEGKNLDENLFPCNYDHFKKPVVVNNGPQKRKSGEINGNEGTPPSSSKKSRVNSDETNTSPSKKDSSRCGSRNISVEAGPSEPEKDNKQEEVDERAKLLEMMNTVIQRKTESRRSSQVSDGKHSPKMPSNPVHVDPQPRRSLRLRSDRSASTTSESGKKTKIVWEEQKEIEVSARSRQPSTEPSQSYNMRNDDIIIEENPQEIRVLPQESTDSLDDFEVMNEKRKNDTYYFLFTNTGAAIRSKCIETIKKLGGNIVESANFENSVTHLIAESPSRSEKYLSSIASGKWMLHPSYLDKCLEKGEFVQEFDYEWGSDILFERLGHSKHKDLAVAGKKWRTKIMEDGKGPFYGWNTILYIEPQRLESMRRLLIQGGASLVITRPELEFQNGNPVFPSLTHALIEERKCKEWNNKDLEILMEKKIDCYETKYLINYLLNSDNIDHDAHLLPEYRTNAGK